MIAGKIERLTQDQATDLAYEISLKLSAFLRAMDVPMGGPAALALMAMAAQSVRTTYLITSPDGKTPRERYLELAEFAWDEAAAAVAAAEGEGTDGLDERKPTGDAEGSGP